jgi:hypothetical protein
VTKVPGQEPTRPEGDARDALGVPHWSTPWQACLLIAKGHTRRTGLAVAGVVGTLLSAVNQGDVLVSGRAGAATWARVAVNYAVPFVVSSVGYLAPFRRPRRRG